MNVDRKVVVVWTRLRHDRVSSMERPVGCRRLCVDVSQPRSPASACLPRVPVPRVAIEVRVDQRLDGEVLEESAVECNEAIVHIPVVEEMDLGVVCQRVVKLVPGMFDEGDGDIAQGGGELRANPGSSNLQEV